MENDRDLFFLSLARVAFLKPSERLLLAEILSGIDDFLRLKKDDLVKLLKRMVKNDGFRPEECLKQAQNDQKYLTKRNILCTFYSDRHYPADLKEIFDPPLVIYHRGALPVPADKMVAVVGTRKPTGNAVQEAFRLGLKLAQNGAVVVSGLAIGIDRVVHSGCLEARGKAVAVLGNGIDSVYPHSSRGLACRILDNGGAILSEYPPGVPPLKHHFPARNRIISGLSKAVIVVEAPEKSGSLITADYALEQGRELFVHKNGCDGTAGRGSRLLAEQGARVITCAEEILGEPDFTGFGCGAVGENDHCRGLSLAELLELELSQRVIMHNGEFYWRGENGCQ